MDEISSFGSWLRQRRQALDLTQDALARRVGYTAATIKQIEQDVRRPSPELAERLAEVLHVPADDHTAFMEVARAERGRQQPSTDEPALPPLAANESEPAQAGSALPSGTVTLLFTDIAGSTQLLQRLGTRYDAVLAEYRRLLRTVFTEHGGQEVDTQGDAFFFAFPRAREAVAAAVAAQRVLAQRAWPEGLVPSTRMGLHTGEPRPSADGYVGLDVVKAARLSAAAHGGQVVLSAATQAAVALELPTGVGLRELGSYQFKDLTHPERVFQLVVPDLPDAFPPLRALGNGLHNVPMIRDRLIGRERELQAARDLLLRTDVGLVTLTGPGGIGKTRLALQVAAEVVDAFPDGVLFVNLAPLVDSGLVLPTIANLLRVPEAGGQSVLETLQTSMRTKSLLLVLDNFEQVAAAADGVAALLTAVPKLKLLVTSRVPLHLYAEHEFPVPPLELPDPSQLPPLERLTRVEAVRLFIRRAQAVKPDFQVTSSNARTVAEICARLDGLPLAIELAAARCKVLSVRALHQRLSSRLSVLIGGPRDLPDRQQTLRNTIDWSYSLLEPGDQTLFSRLAVFRGGCTLAAIEAVCNVNGDLLIDVLEGVTSLVDRSLLRQAAGVEGEPRFTMLETIQEYAQERLEQRGEVESLGRQHAVYFLALVEAAAPTLRSGEERVWLERLEADHDNLRAALQWALHATETDLGLRLAGRLCTFWSTRGYIHEGQAWVEQALSRNREADPAVRAEALLGAGGFAVELHDLHHADDLLNDALSVYGALGNKHGVAVTLLRMGMLAAFGNDFQRLRAVSEEALVLSRELGDQGLVRTAMLNLGAADGYLGRYDAASLRFNEVLRLSREAGDTRTIAGALRWLAYLALVQGEDPLRAADLINESLAHLRELGDKYSMVMALQILGRIRSQQGRLEDATALCRESLVLAEELGNQRQLTWCFEGLATVAARRGQSVRAARLFGIAERLRERSQAPYQPFDEQDRASARSSLDEAAWNQAWAKGYAMMLDEAVAYALQEHDDT